MKGILASLLLLSIAFSTHATSPRPGEFPPPALGNDRSGQAVDLEQLRGKVVIVTFWASWCGPCRKELPVLGHFQKVVGRDALEVVAVNFKEPRREYNQIIRANREMDLTWVHDARGTLSDQYGVRSVPHMFILDRDGKVAFTHLGYSESLLPQIIEEILSLLPDEVKARPAMRS